MINSRSRLILLKIIIGICFIVLAFSLFNMQVINGDMYRQMLSTRPSATVIEPAPRGEIFDRYGNALVTNTRCYNISMFKNGQTNEQMNSTLLKVLDILDECDIDVNDNLPINAGGDKFTFESDDARENWFDTNRYASVIDDDMSAYDVLMTLADVYEVDLNCTDREIRRIVGIRNSADNAGFSSIVPYTVAEDLDTDAVAKIKEAVGNSSTIVVTSSYKRVFENGGVASHLIGRVAKMNAEEYEKNKDNGYKYNDVIGKQGIERSAEKYLRGIDGTKGSSAEVDGKKVSLVNSKTAIPGNNVVLTIDLSLQSEVEKSLQRNINSISASGSKGSGGDCDAGSAVVIDVNTGDVLACASYPTYDIAEFDKEYSKLSQDERRPLWNRAVSGTYTPGSTFKPLTAIAALETGNLKPAEIITDQGVYKFYEDYQPACWIWNSNKVTHGPINVSKAIEQSCNYFFYEAGRRVGIETLDAYAARFGLGEYTGIELGEEAKGGCASPETKKKSVENVIDQGWFGGDTLQAAIGQSYHMFTPVQLANYVAAIANGGTRYKVNLIKGVYSQVDGHEIINCAPQVVDKIDMQSANLTAVREGMRNVVDEGSASAIFHDYQISLGGKTGTAELGNGTSNNAIFIAFAPFDKPEIAVAIVLEHGLKGANAAYVARDIFDYYFKDRFAINKNSSQNVSNSYYDVNDIDYYYDDEDDEYYFDEDED